MLRHLSPLRFWLQDLRLRRAARTYQQQLELIERLAIPDELKHAAKEQAFNRLAKSLDSYLTRS